jgi:hypothetical protein
MAAIIIHTPATIEISAIPLSLFRRVLLRPGLNARSQGRGVIEKLTTIDVPDEKTSIPKLKRMNRMLDAVYRQVMQKGTDYDTLPGFPKPILLKPGAELLARHFDLVADTKIVGSVEKIDQEVPYFEYDAECRLYNAKGEFVGNGVGSCNTGEPQYGHAWVAEEDLPRDIKKPEELLTRESEGKKQYRVPLSREEAFGLANTVRKKAGKRAFVDAILRVTTSSRLFTQDVSNGGDSKDDDPREPAS